MKEKHTAILREMEAKNQRELDDAKRDGAQIVATLSGLVMVTTPLVVVASAAFIALMLWNNVRERRHEIAVLRAIGKGAGMVASLFLGKAIVMGVLGGVLGCLIGYAMARIVGVLLRISPESFDTPTVLLIATLVGTPIIAVLASYVPTRFAVRQDPALLLQDQ
jgi:putative ABC transport system permease protein